MLQGFFRLCRCFAGVLQAFCRCFLSKKTASQLDLQVLQVFFYNILARAKKKRDKGDIVKRSENGSGEVSIRKILPATPAELAQTLSLNRIMARFFLLKSKKSAGVLQVFCRCFAGVLQVFFTTYWLVQKKKGEMGE